VKRPKKLFNRANQRISLGNAAALLVFAAFVAQLLGFLRTKFVNANFPAFGPESTDAYFAAFKIPDLFYFTLAAGALGVAFMPFLAERLARGDRKSVWDLSNSLLNLLAMVMLGVGVIILVFARPLIDHIVAPTMSPEQLDNATMIMRLIAFNPFLFTVSAIFMSVQQAYGRFFFYALAPIFYNLAIIASIFAFKDNLGLVGLGIGALVGAILQLIFSILGFVGLKYKYQTTIKWENPDFRQILKNLPPRSLDQGIDSVNSIVETNFARRLGEGKLTFYENAYVLHTAPSILIGTAIATASFPQLNDRLAQGRRDLFRKDFLHILRAMIWVTVPVVVVCYFARGYLARLIYTSHAPEIAGIFGFFAVAILFRTIYAMVSRWFYAQKDTKTPLYVSLFAIALNIVLAYALSRPTAYDVAGLAMAQSIVAAAEVIILFLVMMLRDHKLTDKYFWGGLFRILSVTGFTVIAAFIMLTIFPLDTADRGFILTTKLAAIAVATLSAHFAMSVLFDLEEVRPVIAKVRKIILTPVKLQ
jgi:putative peptidoglycan lipid II flippase